MGKYRLHTFFNESDYEEDGGERYYPTTVLGAGSYARARRLYTRSGKAGGVVLDPLVRRADELDRKYDFFKTLYPDSKIEKFVSSDGWTYRLVVPFLPGQAYDEIKIVSPIQPIQLFLSAVNAIAACHQKGIIVVDFSEKNILYDKETDKSFLIDGGLSAKKGEPLSPAFLYSSVSKAQGAQRRCIDRYAPECFSTTPVVATEAMDIYVLGCTMKYVFERSQLVPRMTQLYRSCQSQDPAARPTCDFLKAELTSLLDAGAQINWAAFYAYRGGARYIIENIRKGHPLAEAAEDDACFEILDAFHELLPYGLSVYPCEGQQEKYESFFEVCKLTLASALQTQPPARPSFLKFWARANPVAVLYSNMLIHIEAVEKQFKCSAASVHPI